MPTQNKNKKSYRKKTRVRSRNKSRKNKRKMKLQKRSGGSNRESTTPRLSEIVEFFKVAKDNPSSTPTITNKNIDKELNDLDTLIAEINKEAKKDDKLVDVIQANNNEPILYDHGTYIDDNKWFLNGTGYRPITAGKTGTHYYILHNQHNNIKNIFKFTRK